MEAMLTMGTIEVAELEHAADGDRARKFYGDTFGWQLTHMPEMGYTMVMTGPSNPETGPTEPGFINGGMFERSEQFPGKAPNIVIDVPRGSTAPTRGTVS